MFRIACNTTLAISSFTTRTTMSPRSADAVGDLLLRQALRHRPHTRALFGQTLQQTRDSHIDVMQGQVLDSSKSRCNARRML